MYNDNDWQLAPLPVRSVGASKPSAALSFGSFLHSLPCYDAWPPACVPVLDLCTPGLGVK